MECKHRAGFSVYKIYRDTTEGFTHGPGNLVYQTFDTTWTDPVSQGRKYYYKLTAVDILQNESAPASSGDVTGTDLSVEPLSFALYQNIPNPFNPSTVIPYDVPAGGGEVSLRIFDVSGRFVRTLVEEQQTSGRKTAIWDGRDNRGQEVASDAYFYRLYAPGYEKTLKMTMVQ